MIEKHVSNASAPVHQEEAATSLPLSEAEQPWKRAKLDMLSKHITTVAQSNEKSSSFVVCQLPRMIRSLGGLNSDKHFRD